MASTSVGIDRSKGATIAAPAKAAATPERSPLRGRPDAGSLCSRPGSSTFLETSQVRVYALAAESSAQSEHRNPAIGGRPVFGCLRSTGQARLLDLPELGGDKHAYWVGVDPRTVAANGPLVAYAYTQYYLDTHETWIRVRNLRTGAVIRNCLVGYGMAPHPGVRVTDIILASDGEVGWSAEGEAPGEENPTPGCNPTA